MKGDKITDFSKIEMGDMIETESGNVYTYVSLITGGNVNSLNSEGQPTELNNNGIHKFYHCVPYKPTMLDYVGKYYYFTKRDEIGTFYLKDKVLHTYTTFFANINSNFNTLVKNKELYIKDTLEEIKQVYREYNGL